MTNKVIHRYIAIALVFCAIILLIYVNQHHSSSSFTSKDIDGSLRKQKIAFEKNALHHKLILWSSDFHISPIADIKNLLKDFGVKIIDKSLSGHCHLTNTCEKDLKVINKMNGMRLSPCPNQLRKEFYEAYRNDSEFQSVDAIICTHAASMCELFLPFNKPLIVIASTRYEIGRHDVESWQIWNKNLDRIAAKPFNTIGANNLYDVEYMKYFTSIQNVQLLPNLCDYVDTVYHPVHNTILLGPSHGVSMILQRQLKQALMRFNQAKLSASKPPLQVAPIRELYPVHFEYSDLSAHRAIILLPYQVSIMSLFEFYRMELPIFVPSLELMTNWHSTYRVLNERTWMSVFGQPETQSKLPRHTHSNCSLQSDPNDEFTPEAIKEWIALSDFYQWPHIQTFNSFPELLEALDSANFTGISQAMHQQNLLEKQKIKSNWVKILQKIVQFKEEASNRKELPNSLNAALQEFYGYQLDGNDCYAEIPPSPVGS